MGRALGPWVGRGAVGAFVGLTLVCPGASSEEPGASLALGVGDGSGVGVGSGGAVVGLGCGVDGLGCGVDGLGDGFVAVGEAPGVGSLSALLDGVPRGAGPVVASDPAPAVEDGCARPVGPLAESSVADGEAPAARGSSSDPSSACAGAATGPGSSGPRPGTASLFSPTGITSATTTSTA